MANLEPIHSLMMNGDLSTPVAIFANAINLLYSMLASDVILWQLGIHIKE